MLNSIRRQCATTVMQVTFERPPGKRSTGDDPLVIKQNLER
jgi:hypothetical protein